nr:UBN2 domain-containing protein [Tanacetum cinerariifolium]
MSRDVITTDGEAMINSIHNGYQPLPVIVQVPLAGNAPNAPPTLKDPKFWTAEEKKTRKIDRLARSLLIQGLSNDIYSLIDSNETAKYLWDALERQMRGSEYGKQDRKAAILYECETFKAIEKEQFLDTYLRYLQVINDLKNSVYKKDNCDVNDALGYKTKAVKVTSDPLALVAEKTKEINANMVFLAQIEKVLSDSDESSSSAKETIAEVAYYTFEFENESEFKTSEYYDNPTNYGLFVNNDDDQEIFHDAIEFASENFIENHIDSQKDYDKSEVDHNDSKEKEHLVDKLIQKFNHKISKLNTFEEQNNEFNEQMKVLNEKNDDLLDQTKVLKDQHQFKHVVIDTHVECHEKYAKLEAERYEYMIRYSAMFDNDKQHRKRIVDQEVLFDKISVELDLEIEKCLERLNVCENKRHKMGQTNQTVHMIMPSNDNLYNGRKGIGFENPSCFEKVKDLRPMLYDEKVIGLGYTPMFLTHSDEALEIEKFKRSRENKIEFAYDYGNLNASYVNEKINFEDDYFQDIINPDFEKIDSPFQQTSSLKPYVSNVILEKIIIDLKDEVCVSPISMSKSSCDSKNVEIKLKRKIPNRKSSKQNVKQVDNDVSRANNDFVHFLDLNTFSSVRRPKNSGVIWKKKGSSNTSNAGLSTVNVSNLNKNDKRYYRKDLLASNNSHLGETSAYMCNDAMNVSCDSRMKDLLDDNNFFIFDDESVKISPVSKMPFRKKPRDSINMCSKSNLNKSLPRTV